MMGKLHMFMSIFFLCFLHNICGQSYYAYAQCCGEFTIWSCIDILSHFSGLFFEHDPGQSSESHCNNLTESVIVMSSSHLLLIEVHIVSSVSAQFQLENWDVPTRLELAWNLFTSAWLSLRNYSLNSSLVVTLLPCLK